jgi:pimeloyl-ACP methyl ester carboxylesterase
MRTRIVLFISFLLISLNAVAGTEVFQIPLRGEVFQRVLVTTPEKSEDTRAIALLFPGGHGGLQISPEGEMGWGKGNFLVRTRKIFASSGVISVVVDAPSDKLSHPYMLGKRQTQENFDDVKKLISFIKQKYPSLPLWLVGTSRGTQTVSYVAPKLGESDGVAGFVLTSSILHGKLEGSATDQALEKITLPTLVVHHVQDECKHCPYSDVEKLLSKIPSSVRKELLSHSGGETKGDPCDAYSYHGFYGIEKEAVGSIVQWILK